MFRRFYLVSFFFLFLSSLVFSSTSFGKLKQKKKKRKNHKKPKVTLIDEKAEFQKEYLDFKLDWDLTLSPHAGASWMMTLGEGFEALVPHKWKGRGAGDVLLRTGQSFLDIFFYYHTTLVQHEVFGHGARLREYGANNISYTFGLFHGSAGGNYRRTVQRDIALSAGGIESADIISRLLTMDFLDRGVVRTNRAWSHFFSHGNQGYYIHFFQDLNFPGHDIASYVNLVNSYNGASGGTSLAELRLYGVFDYLNPFLFFSVWSIGRYIATGDNKFEYPMISLGDHLRYLPATRLVLAPYGPEIYLFNYLKFKEYSGKIDLGGRFTGETSSFNLSVDMNPVQLVPWLLLGGHFAFWYQPEMNFGNFFAGKKAPGVLLNLKPSFQVVKNFFVNTQLGYKTKGFIQGEPLDSALLLRLGLSFRW